MRRRSEPLVEALSMWFTTAEWGTDFRTGAIAVLQERERTPEDRPGKNVTVWDWRVHGPRRGNDRAELGRGTAQNQGGARLAARKIIRELPDDVDRGAPPAVEE